MAQVNSEEAARRLARAIRSDIQLYNRDAISQGRDMTEAIAEGRALFEKRVAASLRPIFETVLDETPLGTAIGTGEAIVPRRASSSQPPMTSTSESATPWVVAFIGLAVAAFVGLALWLRR